MMKCDFCEKEVSADHKISCERCYAFLLYLLRTFQMPPVKKAKEIKRKIKKKVRVLKKKPPAVKTKRELQFEKSTSQKTDPASLLTKCATCEFSFLDAGIKKISCTEGKEPKSCGR